MPPKTERAFTVGETVHLRARVSRPGTNSPVDPTSVQLTDLRRNGVSLGEPPVAFTREAEGDYSLVLATDARPPGTYDVRVTITGGADKTVIVPDRFVLEAV